MKLQRSIPARSDWKPAFLGTLVTLAVLLVATEVDARARGVAPSAAWAPDTWTAHWMRLEAAPDDQTVLLGASRMQFGMDMDVWEERTGRRPLMLAWPGSPPWPVLSKLVEREQFRGDVYISLAPSFAFIDGRSGFAAGMAATVAGVEMKRWSLSYRMYERLWLPVQNAFSAFNTDACSPIQRLREALLVPNREGARQPALLPHTADFTADNALRFTETGLSDPAIVEWLLAIHQTISDIQGETGMTDMDALVAQVKADVAALEARGSRVVFVRFPSDGGYLDVETRVFSREQCYDRVVLETAADGVHYADHEERLGFTPPEWSHLDSEQAVKFTRAFLDIVEELGVTPLR
jgi:hypothetical protein